jgi:GntR family transcriptional regulator/MocR family aminotransferase
MARPVKTGQAPVTSGKAAIKPARPRGRFAFQLELDVAGPAGTVRDDEGNELPMFLRIARAIARDARSGRLAKGALLPSTRELALSLGVHRNTVIAAYRELTAEGFIQSTHGKGTFIAATLPEIKPRRFQSGGVLAQDRSRPGFAFEARPAPGHATTPRNALALYGGIPDTRLVPREAFGRAFRRALRARTDYLGYGDPQGDESLRTALADMLRTSRGLSITAEDILLTRGSQMALALLGRLLLGPSDVIAVESLGYQPAWRSLTAGGATLRTIPVDGHGMDVEALAELCEREPVRAVYVTPHHQYPTTVTMSAGRRMALLALAKRKRFAIIEDDYDHESHYDGRPVLPLASADDGGVVLYIGTLSKVFAPGLRIGYLIAPPVVREAAVGMRIDIDRQGERLTERAIAELIEDGELQRHVWRAKRIYQARRDHCVSALREAFGELIELDPPSGGMSLWTRFDRSIDVAELARESEKRGVLFQPGHLFTATHRPSPHARIGYGCLDETEMREAIIRLKRAVQAVRKG